MRPPIDIEPCHGEVNAAPPGSASGAGPCIGRSQRLQTRRAFLKATIGAASAGALGRVLATESARAAEVVSTLPAIGTRPTIGPIDAAAKSVVAHLQSDELISGTRVHPELIGELVEEGIRIVTGADSGAAAWNALLRPDDVVGIKFNHVGADFLATTVPFATQLVQSLGRAGFAPERIMLIEAPPGLGRELKTRREVVGWSGKPVTFNSGEEELAAVLQEVTAIINVPFLKTHNLAGMSGCLKNLSHALIRRPGRYHANACTPFVGDIVALPQIQSRLRIHIMNALRAVFDSGPQATLENTWAHRGVLVSRDPVAADSVALDLINDRRARSSLPAIGDADGRVPQLRAAAARHLGTHDQDYIQLVEPDLE